MLDDSIRKAVARLLFVAFVAGVLFAVALFAIF